MKKKQGFWKRQRERQRQLEQQVRKLQEPEREKRVLEDERLKQYQQESDIQRRIALKMQAQRDVRGFDSAW